MRIPLSALVRYRGVGVGAVAFEAVPTDQDEAVSATYRSWREIGDRWT